MIISLVQNSGSVHPVVFFGVKGSLETPSTNSDVKAEIHHFTL